MTMFDLAPRYKRLFLIERLGNGIRPYSNVSGSCSQSSAMSIHSDRKVRSAPLAVACAVLLLLGTVGPFASATHAATPTIVSLTFNDSRRRWAWPAG
jgi:hypothetical protein